MFHGICLMTQIKVQTCNIHLLTINELETIQHLFCLLLEDALLFVVLTVQLA
jgi:hypothetical protein